MVKLGAKELRVTEPTPEQITKIKRNPIYIILDNVLDTYNVGSIFRLADAVAAQKIFLCGETETPPNHKIKKASIDTWRWVPWEYCQTAREAIQKLKSQNSKVKTILRQAQDPERSRGTTQNSKPKNQFNNLTIEQSGNVTVVALEQHPKSIPYNEAKYEFPLAVVVGNETDGVSKEVLEMADKIVEIPMWGVNKSLNVMVSLAIVLYEVMKQSKF